MLGFMSLSFFRQSPLLAYPLAGLMIFMLVFLVVTLRAVLTKKSSWEAVSRLPLEERTEGDAS